MDPIHPIVPQPPNIPPVTPPPTAGRIDRDGRSRADAEAERQRRRRQRLERDESDHGEEDGAGTHIDVTA